MIDDVQQRGECLAKTKSNATCTLHKPFGEISIRGSSFCWVNNHVAALIVRNGEGRETDNR